MKKRGFLNLCFVATLATVTAGSLYSCKDYDDEIFAQLDSNKQESDTSVAEQLSDQKQELEGKISKDVEAAKKEASEQVKQVQDQLDNFVGTADEKYALQEDLEALEKRVENLDLAQSLIKNRLDEIEALLENFNVEDFVKLQQQLDELSKKLEGYVSTEALNETLKNYVTTDEFKKVSDELLEMKESLNEKVEQGDIDKAVENLLKDVEKKDSTLQDLLKKEIKEVSDSLTSLKTTVGDLKTRFENAETQFKENIKTLQKDVADLKSRVDALEEKVDNMITSVLLNGAKSPVVGYFALPTGLKSNILAAYYGQAETNEPMGYFAFPSPELQSLVGKAKDNSTVEFENGKTILAEGFNAGKVYLTVNPSSVNMANKTFSLINSKGEPAPLVFDSARLSEDKLTFGYSRAGQNKNFYEVKARLNEDQIANAKLRMEISEMKEALGMVKDAVLNDASLDVTQLASAIFKCVNDIADANAVKVSWETTGVDNKKVQHDVTSDYGLAAVAIKPLSYDFMKDYEITNFWGIDKAYNLLDRLIAEANDIKKGLINQFPDFSDIDVPNIDSITVKPYEDKFIVTIKDTIKYHFHKEIPLTFDSIKIDSIKVPGDTLKVKDENGNEVGTVVVPDQWVTIKPQYVPGQTVVIDEDLKIPVDISVDMTDKVKELYKDMTGSVETDVNKMIGELKTFVNQLDPIIQQLNQMKGNIDKNLSDVINKVNGKLNSLIGKVNNVLCKVVNNVNEALQPVMFAQAGDFVMVSRAENAPSVYAGDKFVLVPSSYSAEFLAPAAQKFIAVTNVIKGDQSAQAGNGDCQTAMKNVNSKNADLCRVLAGDNHAVGVEHLEKGFTYEFTYSAVDYYGKVRNTKCYVAVK